ncbi:MAG: hypothetical protein R3E97_06460 [Candidatus Eisenbacteria bacterium]
MGPRRDPRGALEQANDSTARAATVPAHYSFPPYSVGETRPLRGRTARDRARQPRTPGALAQILPTPDDFLYTLKVESEITESNGSSSMATVCGGCLALMDAGVPITRPVAGIAMGLISDGDETVILSDILGNEDHLGDMDFKVAGTNRGITAIQLDNKLGSLPADLLARALEQAKRTALHPGRWLRRSQNRDLRSPRTRRASGVSRSVRTGSDLIGRRDHP